MKGQVLSPGFGIEHQSKKGWPLLEREPLSQCPIVRREPTVPHREQSLDPKPTMVLKVERVYPVSGGARKS